MLTIDQLDKADSEDIVSLSEKLGWDYSKKEINLMLSCGTVGTLNKLVTTEYKGLVSEELKGLQSISNDDVEEIIQVDKKGFGADRSIFLRLRMGQAKYRFMLHHGDGKIYAYALGVQTPATLVIGPVVAPESESAYSLTLSPVSTVDRCGSIFHRSTED